MTRKTRGALLTTVGEDLMQMKDDILNDELSDRAVRLYAILNDISNKYTEDAIVDIIPELISLLNRLDASLKINDDLKSMIEDTGNENKMLKKYLEEEKKKRKVDFEESLNSEENAECEISQLKSSIEKLVEIEISLKQELEDKNKLVKSLKGNVDELLLKIGKQESELLSLRSKYGENCICKRQKDVVQQKPYLVDRTNSEKEIPLLSLKESQRLSPDCEDSGRKVVVKAQVHREPNTTKTHFTTLAEKCTMNGKTNMKRLKRIVVLADSHGRNLSYRLQELCKYYNVCVYTKPGAKIKSIIKEGKHSISNLGKDDFLVVLAGTNDMNRNEPGQLTVGQGINHLISIGTKTNVIISSIPYRYDVPYLNDNISFVNMGIAKKIRSYEGKLNIVYEDINLALQRTSYTTHGLHLNKRGKHILCQNIANIIHRQSLQSLTHDSKQQTADVRGRLLTPQYQTPCRQNHFAARGRAIDTVSAGRNRVAPCSVGALDFDAIYPDPNYVPSRSVPLEALCIKTPNDTHPPSIHSLTDYPFLNKSTLIASCEMTSNNNINTNTSPVSPYFLENMLPGTAIKNCHMHQLNIT